MPTDFAPGPAHPFAAPQFAGAALLDAEKLDVYRIALEFQAIAGQLVPKRSYAELRDQLDRASISNGCETVPALSLSASSRCLLNWLRGWERSVSRRGKSSAVIAIARATSHRPTSLPLSRYIVWPNLVCRSRTVSPTHRNSRLAIELQVRSRCLSCYLFKSLKCSAD